MANLSWLLYKNYYSDFFDWPNLNSKDSAIKSKIQQFFDKKNSAITGYIFEGSTELVNSDFNFVLFTTYPGLLTGSGYNHEIGAIGEVKMGYFMDYTSGLPCLPGSTVKGVIRNAFPKISYNKKEDNYTFDAEEKSVEWKIQEIKTIWISQMLEHLDDTTFLTKEYDLSNFNTALNLKKIYQLIVEIFEGQQITNSDGKEEYKAMSIYSRDIFYDAMPISGNNNNKLFGMDAIAKHSKLTKNPVPINFFTILPEVAFKFNFDLKNGEHLTSQNKMKLFQKILLVNGIGAKANVGYGQLVLKNKNLPTSINFLKLQDSDSFDISILRYLKKGGNFSGKILRVEEGVATILINIQGSVSTIYRKSDKIKGYFVGASDIKIQINADYDLKKLNCKIQVIE